MKHSIVIRDVSRETLSEARKIYEKNETQLEEYIDKLLSWNQKINLVSRSVSRETLREHVVHSLFPMVLGLIDEQKEWIDSGTGGGLPGIPLAICNPQRRWLLNDNVKKKMMAVSDILEEIHISNCTVIAKSISLVNLQKETGILTKHAFKIEDLLRLLGSKPWKTIIMWKGAEGVMQEINRSKEKLNYTLYKFEFEKDEGFYEGKSLLKIEQ